MARLTNIQLGDNRGNLVRLFAGTSPAAQSILNQLWWNADPTGITTAVGSAAGTTTVTGAGSATSAAAASTTGLGTGTASATGIEIFYRPTRGSTQARSRVQGVIRGHELHGWFGRFDALGRGDGAPTSLRYGFDWARRLQDGETLVGTPEMHVLNAPDATLAVSGVAIDGTRVTGLLTGGEPGVVALVRCITRTSRGRTLARTSRLPLR